MKFRVIQGPPKKNSRQTLRSGQTIPSKKYMAWHILASEQLQDIVPKNPITSTSLITLGFVFNSKHKRDLTNFAESVMDLMVDLEILEDDNLFVCPKVNLEFIGFGKDEDGIGWTDVNIEENL